MQGWMSVGTAPSEVLSDELRELAHKLAKKGFRFSGDEKPLNIKRMQRFLRLFDISGKQYKEWTGWNLLEWIKWNPIWTLRAWEILVVENMEIITGE